MTEAKDGMLILNTYKLEVETADDGYKMMMGSCVSVTIASVLSSCAVPVLPYVFCGIAAVLFGVAAWFFSRDPIETDVDVIECVFETENALQEAKNTYEVLDSRGSIFSLAKKSDLKRLEDDEEEE